MSESRTIYLGVVEKDVNPLDYVTEVTISKNHDKDNVHVDDTLFDVYHVAKLERNVDRGMYYLDVNGFSATFGDLERLPIFLEAMMLDPIPVGDFYLSAQGEEELADSLTNYLFNEGKLYLCGKEDD